MHIDLKRLISLAITFLVIHGNVFSDDIDLCLDRIETDIMLLKSAGDHLDERLSTIELSMRYSSKVTDYILYDVAKKKLFGSIRSSISIGKDDQISFNNDIYSVTRVMVHTAKRHTDLPIAIGEELSISSVLLFVELLGPSTDVLQPYRPTPVFVPDNGDGFVPDLFNDEKQQ